MYYHNNFNIDFYIAMIGLHTIGPHDTSTSRVQVVRASYHTIENFTFRFLKQTGTVSSYAATSVFKPMYLNKNTSSYAATSVFTPMYLNKNTHELAVVDYSI
jgi:hypothetical protein